MDRDTRHDTYTMPLEQVLALLETTADHPAKPRRPRRIRQGARAAARPEPEPDFVRY